MAATNKPANIPEQPSRGGSDAPQSQPLPVDSSGTDTQDAPRTARTSEEDSKREERPGVYHISAASERRISEHDWAQAGISGQGTVVWDAVNGNYRGLDEFSPAALDILRRDDSFRVAEGSNDNN